MKTFEHVEWCPEGYRGSGLAGQRIAIAGHSHWSDDPDHDAFTDECLRKVISGEWRIAFFTSIARYFGYEDRAAFWSSVGGNSRHAFVENTNSFSG